MENGQNLPNQIKSARQPNQGDGNFIEDIVKGHWAAFLVPLAGGIAQGSLDSIGVPITKGAVMAITGISLLSPLDAAVHDAVKYSKRNNDEVVGVGMLLGIPYVSIGAIFYGAGYGLGYVAGKAAEKLF